MQNDNKLEIGNEHLICCLQNVKENRDFLVKF